MPPETSHIIVVVDDDQDDVFFLKRLLAQCGFKNRLVVLVHGKEAADFFGRASSAGGGVDLPMITFLDVKMPGYSGFDVLRRIRCIDSLGRMPIIMMSSSDEPSDLLRASRHGAQCYLKKFPDASTLSQAIRHASIYGAAHATRNSLLFRFPANLLVSPKA